MGRKAKQIELQIWALLLYAICGEDTFLGNIWRNISIASQVAKPDRLNESPSCNFLNSVSLLLKVNKVQLGQKDGEEETQIQVGSVGLQGLMTVV